MTTLLGPIMPTLRGPELDKQPFTEYDPNHLDCRPIFMIPEIERLKTENITYNRDDPIWEVFNSKNKEFRDKHFSLSPLNWKSKMTRSERAKLADEQARLMKAAFVKRAERTEAFNEAVEAAIAAKTQTSGGYKKRRRGKVTRHRRSKRRNSRRVRRN